MPARDARALPGPHTDEAAARRQQEELELIYASAPVGLCALDRDLRYLRINDRLAEINGIPAAEHIGRTVRAETRASTAEGAYADEIVA